MEKFKTAYRFDRDGYLIGATLVQWSAPLGGYNLPDDCTLIKPDYGAGVWQKYSKDTNSWNAVAIPGCAEDCVNLGRVRHFDQTMHDAECVQLMQKLCEDSTEYRVTRGENLEWFVEAIPQKTPQELELERLRAQLSDAQGNLSRTDYVAAKIAEGAATREEYSAVLANRQTWRTEVNTLEAKITAMENANA